MSSGTSKALGSLLRWREWTESRAELALALSARELERAKAGSQAQLNVVTTIQQQRARMQEGSIDPALLQLAGEIENNAWRVLEARREDEASAQDRRDGAHQALLDARAHMRVVEARHARVAATERDHREKILFDRMADLHAQSRRHRHD